MFSKLPNQSVHIYPIYPDQGIVISQNGNVGIGTTLPMAKLDVVGTISGNAAVINGDIQTTDSNAFYFGDPSTDGTWRILRVGDSLVFQRRESATWIDKNTLPP